MFCKLLTVRPKKSSGTGNDFWSCILSKYSSQLSYLEKLKLCCVLFFLKAFPLEIVLAVENIGSENWRE